MNINLNDTLCKCYNLTHVMCMVFAPLTFIATALPPILIFVELITKKFSRNYIKSFVLHLNFFLYLGFLLIGITVVGKSLDHSSFKDLLAFIIGLGLTILFTIVLIVNIIKVFSKLSYFWKILHVILLFISYMWVIYSILAGIGLLNFDIILLILILLCAIISGINIIYSAVKEYRGYLSFKVFLSIGIAFGFWIGLMIILMRVENMKLNIKVFPEALIIFLCFALYSSYTVCCFFISDNASLVNEATERLTTEYKFGANVRALSEASYEKE